jgi:hypothetical protein
VRRHDRSRAAYPSHVVPGLTGLDWS